MPEPITTAAIVALQSLATKLVESVQDRKEAAKAQEILRLVGTLQTEHFALQQQVIKTEAENTQLRQRVATLEAANAQEQPDNPKVVVDLDELAVRMLRHLSQPRHSVETPYDLSRHLGISVTRARHYAVSLVSGGYLHDQHYANGKVEFQLSDRAREFLVAHNLDV